jgi:hypothetical protein
MTGERAEEKLHKSFNSVKDLWILFENPIFSSHENRISNIKRLTLLGVTFVVHVGNHSKSLTFFAENIQKFLILKKLR